MTGHDVGEAGTANAAARINLVHIASENYAGVQQQILGAITRHLAPEEFSTTVGERAPDSLNFSLFIRLPTDVLMSHGLADKNYFLITDENGERISNRLEHLFVPGEWLKRRLLARKDLEIGAERIHVVGWPRLDLLLATQQEMPVVPRSPGARPKVLWAPTHDFKRRGEEDTSTSSYPDLLEFVPMFEKHFDLAVSLHPRNRTDKEPTHHSLLDCDYVISDFGTIVYEAWALGKPVIFPHWLIGDRIKRHLGKAAEAFIFHERLGLHADSPQQVIDFVMSGAGIDARTTAFLDDYLEPAYAGRSGERVAALLQSLSAPRTPSGFGVRVPDGALPLPEANRARSSGDAIVTGHDVGEADVAAPINVVHTASKNYAGIQKQLLGAITRHLAPEEFSTTVGKRAPDSLNFSLFIRLPTDVLMSHGLADKNYFLRKDEDGERISNRLAHLFVPGEWLKRRLLARKDLEIGAERIHVVGWPRLDLLLATQQELPVVPRSPGARPKVLWAPTHDYARRGEENDSTSSYPELLEFVPMFEKHFDLAISLHPRNRTDKEPTHHSLLDCDYVISDFGTIVYEAWALGKPVIFPHWLIGDRIKRHLGKSAEAFIFHKRLGLHAHSPQQVIDFVMSGAGIDKRTTAFLDDYLEPEYAGRSGERVAALLQSLSAPGNTQIGSVTTSDSKNTAVRRARWGRVRRP